MLDLGRYPWESGAMVLPELGGLRVVRMRIGRVAESIVDALMRAFSEHILAIHPRAVIGDKHIVSPVTFPRCQ